MQCLRAFLRKFDIARKQHYRARNKDLKVTSEVTAQNQISAVTLVNLSENHKKCPRTTNSMNRGMLDIWQKQCAVELLQ